MGNAEERKKHSSIAEGWDSDQIYRASLSREGRSRTCCEVSDHIATAQPKTDPTDHRTKAEREALWSGSRVTNVDKPGTRRTCQTEPRKLFTLQAVQGTFSRWRKPYAKFERHERDIGRKRRHGANMLRRGLVKMAHFIFHLLVMHVVSSQTREKSILSCGENAGSGRPDANTLLFGAGGHEHVLPKIEVNELRRASRITRRVAHTEKSAMEQNTRLALFHQNEQFQLAVREHQRRARDAVSQAVLDSSDRLEVTLSLELRQAQLGNVSTIQHRERDILWSRTHISINSLKNERHK